MNVKKILFLNNIKKIENEIKKPTKFSQFIHEDIKQIFNVSNGIQTSSNDIQKKNKRN